eukprot:TRINITY_DN65241_c0_g1_i1.p1 TRINITY_DN65241_c0_g1~~TRINITY_DN65241_c0_g1_i1.p1  ORF type:complete len:586 (-),score=85.23 TRINITY_DN65241_c0_g1_i1:230-1987(-)
MVKRKSKSRVEQDLVLRSQLYDKSPSKEEEELKNLTIEFLEATPHKQSPTAHVQNGVRKERPGLYESVVGAVYLNGWHEFILAHADVFEIVPPATRGQLLIGLRRQTGDDRKEKSQNERQRHQLSDNSNQPPQQQQRVNNRKGNQQARNPPTNNGNRPTQITQLLGLRVLGENSVLTKKLLRMKMEENQTLSKEEEAFRTKAPSLYRSALKTRVEEQIRQAQNQRKGNQTTPSCITAATVPTAATRTQTRPLVNHDDGRSGCMLQGNVGGCQAVQQAEQKAPRDDSEHSDEEHDESLAVVATRLNNAPKTKKLQQQKQYQQRQCKNEDSLAHGQPQQQGYSCQHRASGVNHPQQDNSPCSPASPVQQPRLSSSSSSSSPSLHSQHLQDAHQQKDAQHYYNGEGDRLVQRTAPVKQEPLDDGQNVTESREVRRRKRKGAMSTDETGNGNETNTTNLTHNPTKKRKLKHSKHDGQPSQVIDLTANQTRTLWVDEETKKMVDVALRHWPSKRGHDGLEYWKRVEPLLPHPPTTSRSKFLNMRQRFKPHWKACEVQKLASLIEEGKQWDAILTSMGRPAKECDWWKQWF